MGNNYISGRDISVIHLVRKSPNWKPAFLRFCESLDENTAALARPLVLACKGLSAEDVYWVDSKTEIRDTQIFSVPDSNFDLGSYYKVVEQLDTDWVLFLNSNSVILSEDWLASYIAAANASPAPGIIGATASFASNRFRAPMPSSNLQEVLEWPIRLAKKVYIHTTGGYKYPAFPNPHVRTNAFLINVVLYQEFVENIGMPQTKSDTHLMESGNESLTRFIRRKGLDVRLAAKGKRSFALCDWRDSETYCSPASSGLLVSDNQTRLYEESSIKKKRILEFETWGKAIT